MRITGMATGMDTEATVKQMMKPYTMKVDKMKQDRQVVAWRQELYRDILSDTTAIRDTYFNNAKLDTNMLSKNNYSGFDVTAASSTVGESAGASATASVGAVAGNYKVLVVNLATAAKVEGNETKINVMESSPNFDVAKWQGKDITFKTGGISTTIKIGDSGTIPPVTDRKSLIADINKQLDITSLSGKITVSEAPGGGIRFSSLGIDNITVDTTGGTTVDEVMSKWTKSGIDKYTTKLSDLGIIGNDNVTLNFNYNGAPEGGKPITVSKDATISQLMDAIDKGTGGAVKLNFSELTGKFSLESSQIGSLATLKVTPVTGDVLTKLNLTAAAQDGIKGTDAKVRITPPGKLDFTEVEKSSNTLSIDGVNYTLTKANAAGDVVTNTNITVTGNSQKTYDKIKGFIDKYNELVEKVSEKTDEKKQYKYLPLTDEQRTAMKEDEIKQWETKAKVGLLKGDSNLDNMLTSMRRAFYDGVEGAGISLSEIGLSTSSDISQRGKIMVNETKLKAAIATKGEQVADLFTKQSTTYSSYNADATSDQRNTRNAEQGVFQRINDIIQDYTKSTGKKGILVQKAGIKGDISSLLSKDIIKKDQKISEMIKNLAARENSYYLKFSKLETAMNKLNSQSNWLTQQLGGGK
ncbi:flagellar filament capping protein FliD [Clostridium tagluense]|uniref:flagellar filament capping protein FliD n=1 Tax=Clostridium tagluense TaxID=360422 RepID=UPI001C6E908D|nr:flagellar filament capping protein FliD [Clostridium tagluense]MBW9154968.1 flagellar filament capping protein FliD [Clostridium tagluense]WLC64421.1 flagellar filament capping protein FliD [Clostridium tagluense]